MKTNKFLKELNKIAHTSFDGKVIEVSAKNGLEIEDDWFLKINPSARIPVVGKQWKNIEEYPISSLRELLNLIEKLEETPVKERFSEKKYRLRWVNDNDGISNYLDYLAGEWRLLSNKDVRIFTETELQQLKINNPSFAPVIDAIKEPVEDD